LPLQAKERKSRVLLCLERAPDSPGRIQTRVPSTGQQLDALSDTPCGVSVASPVFRQAPLQIGGRAGVMATVRPRKYVDLRSHRFQM